MANALISVVIPAFNEAESIGAAIDAVLAVFAALAVRLEIVVVDDGSTDGTPEIVAAYTADHPVRLVELSRNFGKETAILAGLDQAAGDAVIVMDADLQEPIEVLPRFIDYWRQGYDVAYAVRAHRRDEPWRKRVGARVFYGILNFGSRIVVTPDMRDLRIMDRSVVDSLRSLRESVRFTKGLYAWVGYRSIAIPVVLQRRRSGSSKFTSRALRRLAWDGLTSFSDFPLRIAAMLGSAVAAMSLLYATAILVRTLVFGVDVAGWATLTVALTFLGGVQLFFLGLIGEYVRNIFIESKRRPNYLIRSRRPTSSADPVRALGLPRLRSERARPALIPVRQAEAVERDWALSNDGRAGQ
jgi:glycosyltransferase involved in cell wall biosynthesis